MDGKQINWEPTVLWTNAAVAFMLNVSIYLLIGKTSALTMNVAGPVKDWMLIYLSSLVFDAPITSTQARSISHRSPYDPVGVVHADP